MVNYEFSRSIDLEYRLAEIEAEVTGTPVRSKVTDTVGALKKTTESKNVVQWTIIMEIITLANAHQNILNRQFQNNTFWNVLASVITSVKGDTCISEVAVLEEGTNEHVAVTVDMIIDKLSKSRESVIMYADHGGEDDLGLNNDASYSDDRANEVEEESVVLYVPDNESNNDDDNDDEALIAKTQP